MYDNQNFKLDRQASWESISSILSKKAQNVTNTFRFSGIRWTILRFWGSKRYRNVDSRRSKDLCKKITLFGFEMHF